MVMYHVLIVLVVVAVAALGMWLARNPGQAQAAAGADSLAADRIPLRPAPLPHCQPMVLGEDEVAELAVTLIAEATRVCRRDAELRANVRLMDEYASRPLKQRPKTADAAPGEPWVLPVRLVEQAKSEFSNPQESS